MKNGRKAPRKGTWPMRPPPAQDDLESGYLVLASKAQDVAWRLLAWAEMALAEAQDPETVKGIAAVVAQVMRVVDEAHKTIAITPRRPPGPVYTPDDELIDIVPPDAEDDEEEMAKA